MDFAFSAQRDSIPINVAAQSCSSGAGIGAACHFHGPTITLVRHWSVAMTPLPVLLLARDQLEPVYRQRKPSENPRPQRFEKESAQLLWWPSAWSRSHTKHDLRVPAERGGSDPRSPEGSGRDFAARWGPPALSCRFGACIFLASLLRIYSSCKDFASSVGDAPSSFEIAVSRTCQPSPHLFALSPNIPSWPGTTMV
jgi:hypothetical protein